MTKRSPGVVLDLSSVAKGYAVDLAAEGVTALGATAFAVEVGGEVRVSGTKPDGTAWRVAIEQPVADTRVVARVLELHGGAVATSGDYRSFFEADGVRFAHIIDPRTGRPVAGEGFSVTVLHERAAYADAWATALSVLGPDEGLRIAEQNELAVLFLFHENGDTVERASELMRAGLASARARP